MVVAGMAAGGVGAGTAEVGGPDMATAGMVLVILIGAGMAAVTGRAGVVDTGVVVITEAGTAVITTAGAVTGISRNQLLSRGTLSAASRIG
jgi:hypothetical protein